MPGDQRNFGEPFDLSYPLPRPVDVVVFFVFSSLFSLVRFEKLLRTNHVFSSACPAGVIAGVPPHSHPKLPSSTLAAVARSFLSPPAVGWDVLYSVQ